MEYLQSVLWHIRAVFSRKLGVCPFCMRSAGLGTVLSWALFAAASFAFPHSYARAVLLIAAAAFTTLMTAHIVAYVARTVIRVRDHARSVERSGRRRGAGLDRREFLDLVLRASALAIIFSLPGAARVFAGALACDQEQNPFDSEAQAVGATQAEAERQFAGRARVLCDDYCANSPRHYPCIGLLACVQSQPPDVHKVCGGAGVQFHCKGFVKSCFCGCASCNGTYEPIPPDDEAVAATEAGLGADAADRCRNLCAKRKCGGVPPCALVEFAYDGDHKRVKRNGINVYVRRIKSCKCACP